MSVYDSLGVQTIINASGPVTRLGGAAMSETVLDVFQDAARAWVPLEQLQAAASTEENKAWSKKVLHLIGARDEPSIPIYMNNYKNVIEAPMYGGRVYTFKKTSNDPIDFGTGDAIDSLITTGVSLINMFGHAYSDGTDFNLVPGTMKNYGKYPFSSNRRSSSSSRST